MNIPPLIKHHFIRWHRRFGIFAAFFILVLAVTGILLNHSNALTLDKKSLSRGLQAWLYGIQVQIDFTVEANNGHWFAQLSDQTVYWDSQKIAVCEGKLLGAHYLEIKPEQHFNGYLLWCENELLLLSSVGELEERIGAFQELPAPLESAGFCDEGVVCFESSKKHIYRFNMVDLSWLSSDEGDYSPIVTSNNLPSQLQQEIERKHTGNTISVERMILDLHSGRLFGAIGVWLVDIIGIMIILLALSGLFLWFGRRRR